MSSENFRTLPSYENGENSKLIEMHYKTNDTFVKNLFQSSKSNKKDMNASA